MLKEYKHQFLVRKNMVDIKEDTEEDMDDVGGSYVESYNQEDNAIEV